VIDWFSKRASMRYECLDLQRTLVLSQLFVCRVDPLVEEVAARQLHSVQAWDRLTVGEASHGVIQLVLEALPKRLKIGITDNLQSDLLIVRRQRPSRRGLRGGSGTAPQSIVSRVRDCTWGS